MEWKWKNMVPRTAYYINDGKVDRHVEYIEWNLGFTREAKNYYVLNLLLKVSERFPGKHIAEVTSASVEWYSRALSPIYVKGVGYKSAEDEWKAISRGDVIEFDGIKYIRELYHPAYIHFYCRRAKDLLPTISKIDMFTDVFYNPDKLGLTQAEACACLKLMNNQGNLDVLDTLVKFLKWYGENVVIY